MSQNFRRRIRRLRNGKDIRMDKDELTTWALANGWQMIAGCPSLTKPRSPKEAIVRMVFKTTVVNLEVKKPAGKWERVSGQSYAKVQADPDTALPLGLGLETIPGFTMLMRDNKDRMTFTRMTGTPKS
jgi:hypothetical protein